MPNDQNSSQGRRPHYHRGRRGGERRHNDRRTPSQAAPEVQSSRDHVDVDQIMRDIRARISSRHGIDLSPAQIQELAARRLEAILEPKHVKPALLEQMRRAAGEAVQVPAPSPNAVTPFDEAELYQSHRGFLASLRRWLNPILKLFFNPAPLVKAVNAQAAQTNLAATRETEFYARQTEWNALHYEIIQRLVTELARTTLEMQNLTLRMEAVDAKLDFNERRVRAMELTAHSTHITHSTPRPAAPRPVEAASGDAAAPATAASSPIVTSEGTSDGARRRRRRRRGRRSGFGGPEGAATNEAAATGDAAAGDVDTDNEPDEDETEHGPTPQEHVAEAGSAALEPAHHFSLLQPEERYPSGETMAPTVPSEPRREEAAHPPASAVTVAPPGDKDGGPESPER